MNYLPKLAMGVRRAAGALPTTLDAGVPGGERHGFGAASPRIVPASGGLPIYGNWCGPWHGGGRIIDAVCREHDLCYDREGYFDCGCNRDLVNAMPGAIAFARPKSRTLTAQSGRIIAFAGFRSR